MGEQKPENQVCPVSGVSNSIHSKARVESMSNPWKRVGDTYHYQTLNSDMGSSQVFKIARVKKLPMSELTPLSRVRAMGQ